MKLFDSSCQSTWSARTVSGSNAATTRQYEISGGTVLPTDSVAEFEPMVELPRRCPLEPHREVDGADLAHDVLYEGRRSARMESEARDGRSPPEARPC